MSNLSGQEPQLIATQFVDQRFSLAEQYTTDALEKLDSALDELAGLNSGVDYVYYPAAIDVDRFTGNYPFPSMPAAPVLNPQFGTAPVRPAMTSVSMPMIPDTPSVSINEFTDQFVWSLDLYNRTLLEQFRDRLIGFINNGGTGLAPIVEQAIYDRNKARQEITDEQRFSEIQNFFESRGNSMPSGQHAAAVGRAAAERARMYEEISRSVMIKAAELEQENMRIAQDTLTKVEQILTTLYVSEETLELDAEKARIASSVEVYKAYIQGVIARLEIHKATVESIVAYIRANVAVLEANVNLYVADVSAYSAQVEAEARRMGALADVYSNEVKAVTSIIDGLSTIARVDIEQYKIAADVEIANATNKLKAVEMNVNIKLKDYEMRVERMKASAAVTAQVVASALSSVNASATISDSEGRSFGYSYDETKDAEAGRTTTYQHYIDETP